jgi:ribosome biogenesis GTPase
MTRLERFGFTPERRASCPPGDYARIVSGHGDYFHLVCDLAQGEIIARKKASAFRDPEAVQPVTGDFVRLAYNPHGESRILEVMPRHSVFRRVDPSSSGHGIQILAVNFDVLNFGCNSD